MRVADEFGLRHVGYSEHWHVNTPPDLFRGMREEIERLQPRYAVKVYRSGEIDALNSQGGLTCDLGLAADLLDCVSVAISHYGSLGVKQWLPDGVTRWFGNNAASLALLQAHGYRPDRLWYGPATGQA